MKRTEHKTPFVRYNAKLDIVENCIGRTASLSSQALHRIMDSFLMPVFSNRNSEIQPRSAKFGSPHPVVLGLQ